MKPYFVIVYCTSLLYLSPTEEGAVMVDTSVSLQDILIQAGLQGTDILKQECSRQLLLSLAKCCVEWRRIALHLELTDADIAAIDGDNRTIDEKRIGMLVRWREKLAFKATYKVFVEALLACGRTSDAISACKIIVHG